MKFLSIIATFFGLVEYVLNLVEARRVEKNARDAIELEAHRDIADIKARAQAARDADPVPPDADPRLHDDGFRRD